jgi:hypothetical protein
VHRGLVYGQEEQVINNTNVNYVSTITSTTMHENKCFYTENGGYWDKGEIVTIPTKIVLPE